jgi:pantothenate kinase
VIAPRLDSGPGASVFEADLAGLVGRARDLIRPGQRSILGITGAPGAGKSTLVTAMETALGGAAVAVGMDGFHFAQAELGRLDRRERKGAPDTFDARGYAALLRRLHDNREPVVYAPLFRRDLEEPVGSSVPVPRGVPLVITEGNYLLLNEPGWADVRGQLDEVWFLDIADDLRRERLIERHIRYGLTLEVAAERVTTGSDERNARAVNATRSRADLVVRLLPD